MRCPQCARAEISAQHGAVLSEGAVVSANTRVVDSRPEEMSIRRRRECGNCGHRFTTYERLEVLACPHCEAAGVFTAESRVASYQLLKAGSRRYRECLRCGREFTSTERVDPVPLTVVKRDGRREEFNRGKLREKISTACWKRPVGSEQIGEIVEGIERDLLQIGEPEVESTVIGDRVMQRLRTLDEVAYVRFASVYRHFEDIDSIAEEIAEYQQWKRRRAQPDQIALLPEESPLS